MAGLYARHRGLKSFFKQKFAQIEANLGKEEATRLKSIVLSSYKPIIVDHEIAELINKAQKSGIIVLDYEKNEVYAGRLKDSAGVYSQFPYFKQGENIIEPDSIRFNTKTGKAQIWNTRSKQGEMFLRSEVSKRENDSVIFFKNDVSKNSFSAKHYRNLQS